MSGRRKRPDVALERDATWWLHPALRGRQTLPLVTGTVTLPHRWVRSDGPPARTESMVEDDSPYADLAKVLYRINGCRPGPVRGFYVIVGVEPGRYAVGQLCADPAVPVQLFEDLVCASEADARAKAATLRAAEQTPTARSARAAPVSR